MKLPYPLLWLALVAMWLALSGTATPGQTLLGALIALAAVIGLRALQSPRRRTRRPVVAARLAARVVRDVARSNVDVAAIVLHLRGRGRRAGFVHIPLELRDPAGLAVLACIITATPGTSWVGYDSRSSVLTMHVLDLADENTSVRAIKGRYESLLLEIFE